MNLVPCKCGHLEEQHREVDYSWYARCLECIEICPANRTENLHKFNPDNLKYLENLSESNNCR